MSVINRLRGHNREKSVPCVPREPKSLPRKDYMGDTSIVPQSSYCPSCQSANQWQSADLVWRCNICDPPLNPAFVIARRNAADLQQNTTQNLAVPVTSPFTPPVAPPIAIPAELPTDDAPRDSTGQLITTDDWQFAIFDRPPCPTCCGNAWWISTFGVWSCSTCSPPLRREIIQGEVYGDLQLDDLLRSIAAGPKKLSLCGKQSAR